MSTSRSNRCVALVLCALPGICALACSSSTPAPADAAPPGDAPPANDRGPDGPPLPPDAGAVDGPTADARVPGQCTPMPGVPDRALLVALNTGGTDDRVAVYTLESSGRVVDRGISLTGVHLPQRVAMRADGREALVVYGNLSGDCGVLVVSLEPDGSRADVVDNLTIASGVSPFGVAYGSADHAVVAVVAGGATAHNFIALDRNADGHLAVGPTTAIAGTWPIELAPRPGTDQAVLLRADLLSEDPAEIIPIRHDTTGWVSAGASGTVSPASTTFAVHATGKRVYSPTRDLANPGTGGGVPPGLLSVFRFAGDDLQAEPGFPLPFDTSTIAVAPTGDLLVAPVPVLGPSPSGGAPSTRSYKLQTVSLDGDGVPHGEVVVTEDDFPALLFHGLLIAPNGLLIAGLELYPDQAAKPDEVNPLLVFEQVAPGRWQQVCTPLQLPGQPRIALAP